jgi:hypothetical protein
MRLALSAAATTSWPALGRLLVLNHRHVPPDQPIAKAGKRLQWTACGSWSIDARPEHHHDIGHGGR